MAFPRLPIMGLGAVLAWLFFIPAAAATTATTTTTISVFAAITFSPAPLLFGNQLLGHQTTRVITMTNGSTNAFNNLNMTLTAGINSGDFSLSNDCGGSLAAAASCQISITYLPSSAGSAASSVQVSGSGRTYGTGVSGTGVVTPPAPTPVSIALSPSSISVQDNATAGSIVSTATVTMSDGTTNFSGTLLTSDTHYYQISGMNVVLAHSLSGADDGQHNTVISVGP